MSATHRVQRLPNESDQVSIVIGHEHRSQAIGHHRRAYAHLRVLNMRLRISVVALRCRLIGADEAPAARRGGRAGVAGSGWWYSPRNVPRCAFHVGVDCRRRLRVCAPQRVCVAVLLVGAFRRRPILPATVTGAGFIVGAGVHWARQCPPLLQTPHSACLALGSLARSLFDGCSGPAGSPK